MCEEPACACGDGDDNVPCIKSEVESCQGDSSCATTQKTYKNETTSMIIWVSVFPILMLFIITVTLYVNNRIKRIF
jgi:hypothetical protein